MTGFAMTTRSWIASCRLGCISTLSLWDPAKARGHGRAHLACNRRTETQESVIGRSCSENSATFVMSLYYIVPWLKWPLKALRYHFSKSLQMSCTLQCPDKWHDLAQQPEASALWVTVAWPQVYWGGLLPGPLVWKLLGLHKVLITTGSSKWLSDWAQLGSLSLFRIFWLNSWFHAPPFLLLPFWTIRCWVFIVMTP